MVFLDGIIYKLQEHGGVGVYFNELIDRLLRHSITAELSFFPREWKFDVDQSLSFFPSSCRRFERYRNCPVSDNAQLFHSSYYRLPSRSSMKVITTVHDFTYEHFMHGIRRLVHSWQKFKAIRNSDVIICVSENTRRDLFTFMPDFPKNRVHVVHNGVSDLFYPVGGIQSGESPPYVLFVGRRDSYKNFTAAVTALTHLKDVALYCVGGGPFTVVEQEQLERNLPGRYQHMGGVTTQKLNLLYNGALCLLYPSSYEGFGIPVLEAMRAGCPVVAVNTSSIPEVAGEAALLVEQAAPELLAAAVEKVLEKECRDSLRRKGIKHSAGFSWDRTFEETLGLYEKMLETPLLSKNEKQ